MLLSLHDHLRQPWPLRCWQGAIALSPQTSALVDRAGRGAHCCVWISPETLLSPLRRKREPPLPACFLPFRAETFHSRIYVLGEGSAPARGRGRARRALDQ